jgi:rhomboid protease GluP
MAFGLRPSYKTVYPLDGLSPERFLVSALEAAVQLGWQVHYISQSGIVAFEHLAQSQVTVEIQGDSAFITSSALRMMLFDEGRNKRNVMQLAAKLGEIRQLASEEYLDSRYQELWPFLPPPEGDAFLKPKVRSQAGDILAIFRPAAGYFITPIILNLNILVFLLMGLTGVSFIEPDSKSLIEWGANLGELTLRGEWWRLLTACFLHIGAVHLVMNMYAFLLVGAQLERRLGSIRFLGAYLLTGILASLTSITLHSYVISAGASGAIFGMYGVFLALLSTSLVEKRNRKQLLASILFFVVYNLLNGLKPGIDNAAHVGGLVSGIIIGYLFVPQLKRLVPETEEQPAQTPVVAEQPQDYY